MKINISSKFMKNYDSGSPVSGDREIATAMDENGNVMFFSIGSDNHLYLFKKDSGSPTGWQRTDLSADIGKNIETTHIATAIDRDGKPILAAAVYDTQFRNNPQVYFTKNFNPEPTQNRWIFRGNQPNVEISHIATGADKRGNTLIVISTQQQNKLTNYLVNPIVSDKSWLWKEIPVPLNGKATIALEIGHNTKFEKINGVDALLYTLLKIDDQTTKAVIISLPDFTVYNHQIPLDFNPKALNIISDRRGNSELFLATDRLYHLDVPAQTTKDASLLKPEEMIIGSKSFTHTAKAIVNGRYDNGALEAWILCEDGNLYFTREQDGGGWQEPYPLDKEVGQITGWRNPSTNEIDLFAVNIDDELHHIWQDLTTTRWQDQQILLGGINNSVEYDSFTSRITFSDDQGVPMAGKTVRVKASELTMVKINGSKYFVDASSDVATCQTDGMGNLVIVNKVSSMVSPIVRIEADFLDKAIDLNPNQHIADQLANLTVDDLKNARMQTANGTVTEPLIKNPDRLDLMGVHQAVQELVKLQQKLPSQQGDINAKILQPTLNQEGVVVADKKSDISHRLNLAAIPDGYSWALDVSGSSPVFSNQKDHIHANFLGFYHQKAAMLADPMAIAAPTAIFSDIEHFFGDVWETIKNGFLTVTHLVIEKVEAGIKIVIQGLEDAVHVIVNFAEQVWEVIQLVFEKIGIFFQDLIRWLGFIFNWDDILVTHKVLVEGVNKLFDFGASEVDLFEGYINTFFDYLDEQLSKMQPFPSDIGDRAADAHKADANNPASSTGGVFSQISEFLSGSPIGNWGIDQLMHGNLFGNGEDDGTKDKSWVLQLTEAVAGFTADTFIQELNNAESTIVQIVTDIKKVSGDGNLTINQIIGQIGGDILKGVLQAVRTLLINLLKCMAGILKALKAGINEKIDIPLLSPLYKLITKGADLSLLDGMMLLLAVPATVAAKIITGKAPFQAGDTIPFNIPHVSSLNLATQHNSNSALPMNLAVATALKAGDAEETVQYSEALRGWTYFTAVLYGLCTLSNTVADIVEYKLTSKSKGEGAIKSVELKCGLARLCISLPLILSSFPYAPNKKSYSVQMGVGVLMLTTIFKEGFFLAAKHSAEGAAIKTCQRAAVVTDVVYELILLGLEVPILVMELVEAKEKNDADGKEDVILKFVQHGLEFFGEGVAAVEELEVIKHPIAQAVLIVSAIGLDLGSGGINIARMVMNANRMTPHHNI